MPSYTTSDIRNLVLVGHASSGKTLLAEALLYKAGVLGTMGSIDAGTTVCDFTDEEKHHKYSLTSAVAHCDYNGKHINIIDTPGSPDFMGLALSMLPAADTCAVVINAAHGIEPMTRRMMDRAARRNLCRMIIVNKIDADNVNCQELLESIQKSFGKQCLPINLPANGNKSVVDCFFNPDGDSDLGSVADAHTAIVDQVVEVDEELMEIYLEQGEVTPEQLHAPFEKALREGHLVPICFTAAHPHGNSEPIGISELLDVLVKLAPNPTEGNPRPFVKAGNDDKEMHAEPDPSKHVLAHVFNIKVDPYVGKLCSFRIHQGTVSKDSQLYIDDVDTGASKKPFKIGHLFKLQGAKHVEIKDAIPGDLVAVAKIDDIHFDACLHDSHDEDGIHLKPIMYPTPLSGLAISPKKRGDEQKIADAITKFQEEDPCFKVTRDSATKETVINGLGDLHLRVILEKLKNRYNVEVDTKPPKIAYRETILGKAEGHHRHKKQTGGAGQFGEVYLRVEPLQRDSGFEFVDDTFGGSIPQQFIPAIEKGIRKVLEDGAIAGYPMQDIKVSVYDGKYHPVDSKEIAFISAGKTAFKQAINAAKPVLLEPLVNVEVTVPNQYMGDITGDLSGKRGRIQGTDMLPGDQALIKAIVPLSEVTNYHSQLKSVTGGQGSFAMEFDHYDAVPSNVQQQVMSEYKPQDEED
ncbi:Elongation factor G [Poriferisphaera corsica]|uniref:Elongation factor G n=1 Tax=Poriferisphaera corsica TaxID=2528020 RepID=A0A517YX63_9BACT|nr:elongation factor G [Poriferisphaera corsica]QDU34805.1 Elongation factor G [Poriferisphaera corsica]